MEELPLHNLPLFNCSQQLLVLDATNRYELKECSLSARDPGLQMRATGEKVQRMSTRLHPPPGGHRDKKRGVITQLAQADGSPALPGAVTASTGNSRASLSKAQRLFSCPHTG